MHDFLNNVLNNIITFLSAINIVLLNNDLITKDPWVLLISSINIG